MLKLFRIATFISFFVIGLLLSSEGYSLDVLAGSLEVNQNNSLSKTPKLNFLKDTVKQVKVKGCDKKCRRKRRRRKREAHARDYSEKAAASAAKTQTYANNAAAAKSRAAQAEAEAKRAQDIAEAAVAQAGKDGDMAIIKAAIAAAKVAKDKAAKAAKEAQAAANEAQKHAAQTQEFASLAKTWADKAGSQKARNYANAAANSATSANTASTDAAADATASQNSFSSSGQSYQAANNALARAQQAKKDKDIADNAEALAQESAQVRNNTINLKPPPGDLSILFLGNLFGVVDGVLSGTGSQLAGQMFGVFNAAVLSLAGILISYTLLLSTINSAQDGQFIGQRFSSVWVPVRTVGGAALLLPKASGYCLMQIFIMWVVVQGVGAADRVWEQALGYLNRGGSIIQANVNAVDTMQSGQNADVFNGAYGMLVGQVCMMALEKSMTDYQKNLQANQTAGATCDPKSYISGGNIELFCTTQMPNFMNSVNFLGDNSANVSANEVTIPMPNFTETPSNPYSALNGACGYIKYKNFTVGNRKSLGLTVTQANTLKSSRAVALNQMYVFLAGVTRKIVENTPFLSGFTCSAETPCATASTEIPFGLPLTLDLQECVATLNPYSGNGYKSNACLSWELTGGALGSVLLRGTEIHDAVSTYNGMMSASLYIQEQATDHERYKQQRAFIKDSEQTGWILAGAYYFKLAILNSQVLKQSGGVNSDSDSGIKVCTPGKDNSCGPGVWSTSDFEDFFSTPMCESEDADVQTLYCSTISTNITIRRMITKIIDLISAHSAQNTTIPSVSNGRLPSPTYTNTAYSAANSVYGFLVNSTALVLPGQPGSSQPEFDFITTFNASTNVPQLGRASIRGGPWNIPGQIMTGIYNYFTRYMLNLMMSIITPIVNFLIFSVLQRPLTILASVFLGAMSVLQDKNMNPIIGIANMGVGFIEGASNAWILIILDFIMQAIQAVLNPFLGMVTMGLTFLLMPLVTLWLGILMSVGAMSTFYLPFVPFLIFLFSSIAWLVAVIEAMVAAPLLALGVMHPEGEKPFGKGDQAVMLLLGIFLRPSLMILGYVFGIILSYVGIWFINAGFILVVPEIQNMPAVNVKSGDHVNYDGSSPYNQGLNGANYGKNMNTMDNAMSDAANATNQGIGAGQQFFTGDTSIYGMWSRIFLLFFILLVYISSIISVVSKAFELIHILPDKVMRWISDGQSDDIAGRMISNAKSDLQEAQKEGSEATSEAMAKINSTMINAPLTAAKAVKDIAAGLAEESKAQGGDSDASATGSKTNASATGKKSTGTKTGGNKNQPKIPPGGSVAASNQQDTSITGAPEPSGGGDNNDEDADKDSDDNDDEVR